MTGKYQRWNFYEKGKYDIIGCAGGEMVSRLELEIIK